MRNKHMSLEKVTQHNGIIHTFQRHVLAAIFGNKLTTWEMSVECTAKS